MYHPYTLTSIVFPSPLTLSWPIPSPCPCLLPLPSISLFWHFIWLFPCYQHHPPPSHIYWHCFLLLFIPFLIHPIPLPLPVPPAPIFALWSIYGHFFVCISAPIYLCMYIHDILHWISDIWPLFGCAISCQGRGDVFPFGVGTRPPKACKYSCMLSDTCLMYTT